MRTKELIEQLKKIYEKCSVYFDLEKKKIIIKNERTKERQAEWEEMQPQFRQIRKELREVKTAIASGLAKKIDELPEAPPSSIEEISQDSVYQVNEGYFQRIIVKLERWETEEKKRIENVSDLVEFLEWVLVEQAKEEAKEEKEKQERLQQEIQRSLLEIEDLETEQNRIELESFWRNLHPNFTFQWQESWREKEFDYKEVKEWIEAGLKPEDVDYADWLRDMLDLSPTEYSSLLTSGNERLIKEQYEEYWRNLEEEEETSLARAISLSLEANKLRLLEWEKNERVILLIGRTGSGKSTLGNVLINRKGNFEEVFKESSGSVSQTKELQMEKFSVDLTRDGIEKIHYLVIDTVGFGDTQMKDKEVLQLLKKLIPIIQKKGINQVFFVTGGRFGEKEIESYKLLVSIIFGREAAEYTTIIRTKFPEFCNLKDCEEDRERLRKENRKLLGILQNTKILYLDNPPSKGRLAKINREVREDSRKRLLTHLGSYSTIYHSNDSENIERKIDNYLSEEERLTQELSKKDQQIKEESAKLEKKAQAIQKQKDWELELAERNFQRKNQELRKENQEQIQAITEEMGEVHKSLSQRLKKDFQDTLEEVDKYYQERLEKIRDVSNKIKAGRPVCQCGKKTGIQIYNTEGKLIPEDSSDFIGYIYCPNCQRNREDYFLEESTTYTWEELRKKSLEQAKANNQKIAEAIRQEEERKKELIERIKRQMEEKEEQFNRDLAEQKEKEEKSIAQQEASLAEQRRQAKKVIEERNREKTNRINQQKQENIQAFQRESERIERNRENLFQDFWRFSSS